MYHFSNSDRSNVQDFLFTLITVITRTRYSQKFFQKMRKIVLIGNYNHDQRQAIILSSSYILIENFQILIFTDNKFRVSVLEIFQ